MLTRSESSRTRPASISLEALLVLPVLILAVFGLIQIALLASADQKLEAAATAGVRVAARGGDLTAIETAVTGVLGASPIYANAVVTAQITDGNGDPLPAGALVSVIVTVPAQETIPYPNNFAGPGLAMTNLTANAVAVKE